MALLVGPSIEFRYPVGVYSAKAQSAKFLAPQDFVYSIDDIPTSQR